MSTKWPCHPEHPNKMGFKGKTFYIDRATKQALLFEQKRLDKKHDCVLTISGQEGMGKSSLAKMICAFMDEDFSHEKIVFTPEQFMEAVDSSKPKSSILWDEFVLGGSARDAMTKMQRVLTQKFVTIRSRRLFIVLVIPSFFMLQKYFAIFRTRWLINVKSPDNITRGFFDLYSYPTKKNLYILGSKFMNYSAVKADVRNSRFPNYEGKFVDEVAYEAKKKEATDSISKGVKDKDPEEKVDRRLRSPTNMRAVMMIHEYKNGNFKDHKAYCSYYKRVYGFDVSVKNLSLIFKKGMNYLEKRSKENENAMSDKGSIDKFKIPY